ncbi:hypothetical protein J6590_043691 [Homalodisca vitripennis]|nr:hypothetical protein J6590_043691 [Homalodisca vitripennis]
MNELSTLNTTGDIRSVQVEQQRLKTTTLRDTPRFDQRGSGLPKKLIKSLFSMHPPFAPVDSNNSLCREHSRIYLEDLEEFEMWALKITIVSWTVTGWTVMDCHNTCNGLEELGKCGFFNIRLSTFDCTSTNLP